ncbi:MAG: hypothetical protein ACTTHG_03345 [Treponemataceae bacterium]
MEMDKELNGKLFSSFNEKLDWYNSVELKNILGNYRELHSIVSSLIKTLISKGTIIEDPYKMDKKITDIEPIEKTPFNSNDRASVLGRRLSSYELTLTFISDCLSFTTNVLTMEKIKKLLEFNKSFEWNAFSTCTQNVNTRELAESLISIRQGSDLLAINLVNSTLEISGKTITKINDALKLFGNFQREAYKMGIRKDVLEHPNFDESFTSSKELMLSSIAKIYAQLNKKQPFYKELVEELIEETIGEDREQRINEVFKKFAIAQKSSEINMVKINTFEVLTEALKIMGALAPHLEQAVFKLEANSKLLETTKLTKWQKFFLKLKRALGIKEKPITYKVVVTDPVNHTKRNEYINFSEFILKLEKRIKYFNVLSAEKSPLFAKIEQMEEEQVFEILINLLSESQKYLLFLDALDEFFKNTVDSKHRSDVKGIKMETTGIQNTVIKANQKRAEYISVSEEKKQMEKLGIVEDM